MQTSRLTTLHRLAQPNSGPDIVTRRPLHRRVRASGREGFIIVAVLWILVALATLASIYSIYVNNSALAVTAMDERLQAEALVPASLNLTAYRLAVPKDVQRPTRGQFGFRLGQANVAVNYSSEAARIDLNAASKELLTGFFAALGASRDDASRYADRVIGWREAPKRSDQADEAALYRSAGLPYGPRGAAFAHIDELWLVQGLPPGLVRRALPLATVYSGLPDINVFDAPPELIAALPGMTSLRAADFLNRRDAASRDKDSLSRLLGPDQVGATTEGSNAFRVRTNITFQSGWRTASEAVILLDSSDEPYQVLSWRSDIDADQTQLAAKPR